MIICYPQVWDRIIINKYIKHMIMEKTEFTCIQLSEAVLVVNLRIIPEHFEADGFHAVN